MLGITRKQSPSVSTPAEVQRHEQPVTEQAGDTPPPSRPTGHSMVDAFEAPRASRPATGADFSAKIIKSFIDSEIGETAKRIMKSDLSPEKKSAALGQFMQHLAGSKLPPDIKRAALEKVVETASKGNDRLATAMRKMIPDSIRDDKRTSKFESTGDAVATGQMIYGLLRKQAGLDDGR